MAWLTFFRVSSGDRSDAKGGAVAGVSPTQGTFSAAVGWPGSPCGMNRIAAAMAAIRIRHLALGIIVRGTPLANLILIHASNLSYLQGFFPMSGCVLHAAKAFQGRSKRLSAETTSRLLICTLALTQLCDPVPSLAAKKNPPEPQTVTVKMPAPPKLKQVQGDQHILHALDRLTFGPWPGELEQVKTIGLDAWITQQLHPATIDDYALEERLAQFPAMRLSEQDLTRRFPPGSIIRQVEAGKISVPLLNATDRAIYQNQVVTDRKKQEQDKAKAALNLSGAAANNQ